MLVSFVVVVVVIWLGVVNNVLVVAVFVIVGIVCCLLSVICCLPFVFCCLLFGLCCHDMTEHDCGTKEGGYHT